MKTTKQCIVEIDFRIGKLFKQIATLQEAKKIFLAGLPVRIIFKMPLKKKGKMLRKGSVVKSITLAQTK